MPTHKSHFLSQVTKLNSNACHCLSPPLEAFLPWKSIGVDRVFLCWQYPSINTLPLRRNYVGLVADSVRINGPLSEFSLRLLFPSTIMPTRASGLTLFILISCAFVVVHGACNISRILEFADSDWNCAVPGCSSNAHF